MFSEKGEHDKWQETLRTVADIHFHISDMMEKSQGDNHDIAQVVLCQQPLRPTEEEAALLRMEATCPNLRQLVEALDLEVISVSVGIGSANVAIQKFINRILRKTWKTCSLSSDTSIFPTLGVKAASAGLNSFVSASMTR